MNRASAGATPSEKSATSTRLNQGALRFTKATTSWGSPVNVPASTASTACSWKLSRIELEHDLIVAEAAEVADEDRVVGVVPADQRLAGVGGQVPGVWVRLDPAEVDDPDLLAGAGLVQHQQLIVADTGEVAHE